MLPIWTSMLNIVIVLGLILWTVFVITTLVLIVTGAVHVVEKYVLDYFKKQEKPKEE